MEKIYTVRKKDNHVGLCSTINKALSVNNGLWLYEEVC